MVLEVLVVVVALFISILLETWKMIKMLLTANYESAPTSRIGSFTSR